jgi:hypothetical protein
MSRTGALAGELGTIAVRPVFDHLTALTDERGLFEHALHATPRIEHGYCVDDAARGVVVTYREPDPSRTVRRLRDRYLGFVLSALCADGTCHNRMDADGRFQDQSGLGDWWGRAGWALGTAAARSDTATMRARAIGGFRILARQRSPFSRSMAFAALGAGELLSVAPDERAALELLRDAVGTVDPAGGITAGPDWPWPEARLRYANGTVAEALLVAGDQLPDQAVLARGLDLLAFLLRVETFDGRLSVTPVGGRGPGADGPGFDQQPIEVAAIADACATAYRVTADPQWLAGIRLAWGWFLGNNDSRTVMFDPSTGAGYDGLEPTGRNLNQGAESTLAMLSVAQHASHFRSAR